MKNNDYQIILSFFQEVTTLLKEGNQASSLQAVFIAGSFASIIKRTDNNEGIHVPDKTVPDVNFYLLVSGNERNRVSMSLKLHKAFYEVKSNFDKKSIALNFRMDYHPFSLTKEGFQLHDEAINFQITTRVLTTEDHRNYAMHSWHSWQSNHIMLYKLESQPFDALKLPKHNQRNIDWYRSLYLAILSYSNAIQMLPLYSIDSKYLISETYRYFKELIMDGIHLVVSDKELEERSYYHVLYDWKNEAEAFYKHHYGERAGKIIVDVIFYVNVKDAEDDSLLPDLETFMGDFYELRDIIYKRGFLRNLRSSSLKGNSEIQELLNVLPLWW